MTAWYGWLLLASMSMTIGNKIVAQSYPYANLTILFQNFVAVCILLFGSRINVFQFKPFDRSQFKTMAVPAVLLAMQIVASIKALPHVAVATTVVFRNLATLSVAAAEFYSLKKNISWHKKRSLLIIFAGSVVYAWKDITFDAVGYSWLTLNCVIYTISSIYTKVAVGKIPQTMDGTALIQQVLTLPILACFAYFSNELPDGISAFENVEVVTEVIFVALGFMGTLIALSYMNLYKLVPATSVAVASNINKCCTILVAWFVFKRTLSPFQVVGLLVCIGGGTSYALDPTPRLESAKVIDKEAANTKKEDGASV
jgi:drug/metabolite transporter (DMT)-like permease